MGLFVRKESKDLELLRETLAERERLVQILGEQIEFLRAQLGMSTVTVGRALTPTQPASPETLEDFNLDNLRTEAPAFGSDEEEELQAMRQAQVISEAEYQEGLTRLQSRTGSDIIE